MKPIIYIVTAYRYGNHSDHSYILGAFGKKAKAIKCADNHVEYRGGKYSCEVEEVQIDTYDFDEKTDNIKVVYIKPSIDLSK